jgi:hypothetical protein
MVKSGGREGPFLPQVLPHGEGLFRKTDHTTEIFGSGQLSLPEAEERRLEDRVPMQVPDILRGTAAGPTEPIL